MPENKIKVLLTPPNTPPDSSECPSPTKPPQKTPRENKSMKKFEEGASGFYMEHFPGTNIAVHYSIPLLGELKKVSVNGIDSFFVFEEVTTNPKLTGAIYLQSLQLISKYEKILKEFPEKISSDKRTEMMKDFLKYLNENCDKNTTRKEVYSPASGRKKKTTTLLEIEDLHNILTRYESNHVLDDNEKGEVWEALVEFFHELKLGIGKKDTLLKMKKVIEMEEPYTKSEVERQEEELRLGYNGGIPSKRIGQSYKKRNMKKDKEGGNNNNNTNKSSDESDDSSRPNANANMKKRKALDYSLDKNSPSKIKGSGSDVHHGGKIVYEDIINFMKKVSTKENVDSVYTTMAGIRNRLKKTGLLINEKWPESIDPMILISIMDAIMRGAIDKETMSKLSFYIDEAFEFLNEESRSGSDSEESYD